MLTAITKHKTLESWEIEAPSLDKKRTFISSGILPKDIDLTKAIIEKTGICNVRLDVANGGMKSLCDAVSLLIEEVPGIVIFAGNVADTESAANLAEAGAHAIVVGIGSGSTCTTRIKTGVGVPQLSAISRIVKSFQSCWRPPIIVSDGGCRTPGDIAKAFVAGADIVMLGGMLAAHSESEMHHDSSGAVQFWGMSSRQAQGIHSEFKSYRASEGKVVRLQHKGPVSDTLDDICGSLRSTCTYTNSSCITDLKRAKFIKVRSQYNKVYDSFVIGD